MVTNHEVRRASRALCAASTWASFLLLSPAARAGDPEPAQAHTEPAQAASAAAKADSSPKAEPPASPESAPASNPARAAEAAYQRALQIYATGDIKGAFDSMRESYRLSQRPELLYNLARLERELEECQASLEDYRRYLQRVPNGRYRAAAEQASVELERECPAADPTPVVAPAEVGATQVGPTADAAAGKGTREPPGSAEPRHWTTTRVLGWSAIATGVVAGGIALYFRQAAVAARNDFAASIALQASGKGPRDDSLQRKQHHDVTAAEVLAVSGGALVTGGALLLILGPRAPSKAATNAFIYFPPGGIGACLSRSF